MKVLELNARRENEKRVKEKKEEVIRRALMSR